MGRLTPETLAGSVRRLSSKNLQLNVRAAGAFKIVGGMMGANAAYSTARIAKVRRPSLCAEGLLPGAGYGQGWPGHFLGGERLLTAVRLHEPQVTQELVGWLNCDDSGLSRHRTKSFVRALAFAGSLPPSFDDPRCVLTVHAEVDPTCLVHGRLTTGSRRNGSIDIVVRAVEPTGQRAYLLVEAKLEAVHGRVQLDGYLEALRGPLRGRSAGFFLCVNPPSDLSAWWRLLRWRDLLLQFDSALREQGDCDPSFRRFRTEAFQRVGR